jgi:aflatoxin B1 aldehyde reductase
MTFGAKGADGARVHETKDIEAILDVFLKHGHREVCTAFLSHLMFTNLCFQLDTARVYGVGTGEGVMGKTNWKEKGILMETKLYPAAVSTDFIKQRQN